ncbi:MAG TPA: hypothetical protein PLO37_22505 [Candidatus Hydrogenedentes bacterium]|nr:hypothetical protein [Candidatus Hydrogenedentota bacterium]HPG69628.1 hypothetical protein [Candidatus Hydrogenedentota bacterium]
MAGGLWLSDLRSAQTPPPARTAQPDLVLRAEIKDLQHQLARLSLLNQALWELIRDKAGLTDAHLERMAQEIDLRDGVADGQITHGAVKCPTCGRISNSKHYRCLYCGQEFERPTMA